MSEGRGIGREGGETLEQWFARVLAAAQDTVPYWQEMSQLLMDEMEHQDKRVAELEAALLFACDYLAGTWSHTGVTGQSLVNEIIDRSKKAPHADNLAADRGPDA